MPLKSRLFAGDPALEACLNKDSAHITRGAKGVHVGKIQAVVAFIDGASIDEAERKAKLYGPSTAAAVLAYKKRRKIINTSYQTKEDEIVGKMTIKSLDEELADREVEHGEPGQGAGRCTVDSEPVLDARTLAVLQALKPPRRAAVQSGGRKTGASVPAANALKFMRRT